MADTCLSQINIQTTCNSNSNYTGDDLTVLRSSDLSDLDLSEEEEEEKDTNSKWEKQTDGWVLRSHVKRRCGSGV